MQNVPKLILNPPRMAQTENSAPPMAEVEYTTPKTDHDSCSTPRHFSWHLGNRPYRGFVPKRQIMSWKLGQYEWTVAMFPSLLKSFTSNPSPILLHWSCSHANCKEILYHCTRCPGGVSWDKPVNSMPETIPNRVLTLGIPQEEAAWWFQPLWKYEVSWDLFIPYTYNYMEKQNMFQATNQ